MPPETMKALVLDAGGLRVEQRPIPEPQRGQVLVRMHAAPINPNDLMFVDGTYEVTKPLPVVPGFEGSGQVVATGGGMIGRLLSGRRVACTAGDGDGAWAEYMCTDATRCAPLSKRTELDQGAMLLTNPLTASVLLDRACAGGRRAFAQNAAAGSLGQMVVRLAARRQVTSINIVRREAQVEVLREAGAEHVVVSSSDGAAEQLGELCERFDVRFGLDAIGGDATGQMLEALVDGGEVMIYGLLSGQPCRLPLEQLVFRRKRVHGFTMYEWVEATSTLGQLRAVRAAQKRLADDLRSDIRDKLDLDEFERALELARSGGGGGKILFALGGGGRD